MAFTHLGIGGFSRGLQPDIADKTPADYPAQGFLITEFDTWRQDYAGALVNILRAGTTDLCPVYQDINLTEVGDNPHVLLSRTDDLGNEFGKFQYSLYSPYAYELDIVNSQLTGIQVPPITTLVGKSVSYATAAVVDTTVERPLRERFGDVIRLIDFCANGITANTDTNTTNLNTAIAKASAQGGGVVKLPAGTIAINVINLPSRVLLEGEGKSVTILQSTLGDNIITLTGDGAGLKNLTFDGVSLNGGSIGIYSEQINDVFLENVIVKRFETNGEFHGGRDFKWTNTDCDNSSFGFRFLGDGDEFSGLDWQYGSITNTTNTGLDAPVVDFPVKHNTIRKVDFTGNSGSGAAINLYGAAFFDFDECRFEDNITNINLSDNPDDTLTVIHQVIGLKILNSYFDGGTIVFDGLCQDIYFDLCEFLTIEFQANVPENPIILRDCTETDCTITGDTTKINRFRTSLEGIVIGETTSATPVIVYKTKLEPNEVVQFHISATAERVNGAGWADFTTVLKGHNAAATLLFDEQTANYTAGSQILGATSGATATIVTITDAGTTGSLTLAAISGAFVDNEIIAEVGGAGSARTNGTLTLGSVTAGAKAELQAGGSNADSPPAGWAIDPVASGQELQVQITGAASNTIDWALRIATTRLP